MHRDGFLRTWLGAGTITALAFASSACSGVSDGAAGLQAEGANRGDGGLVADASPRPADARAEDVASKDAANDRSAAGEDASDDDDARSSADAGLPGSGSDDSGDDASSPDATVIDAGLLDAPGPNVDAPTTGPVDAATDATRCTGTLSGVAKGDFDVSFTFKTTQNGHVALLNQRNRCMPSTFWDIRLQGGSLDVEIDDVANYTQVTSDRGHLNDGSPHDVLVQRRSGTLRVSVDGTLAGTSGSEESLTGLASVSVSTGADVCDGQDGTVALAGTITHVCVNDP